MDVHNNYPAQLPQSYCHSNRAGLPSQVAKWQEGDVGAPGRLGRGGKSPRHSPWLPLSAGSLGEEQGALSGHREAGEACRLWGRPLLLPGPNGQGGAGVGVAGVPVLGAHRTPDTRVSPPTVSSSSQGRTHGVPDLPSGRVLRLTHSTLLGFLRADTTVTAGWLWGGDPQVISPLLS